MSEDWAAFDGRLFVDFLRVLPVTWPTTGPCGRCRALTTRYGETGHALCPGCRGAQPNPTER